MEQRRIAAGRTAGSGLRAVVASVGVVVLLTACATTEKAKGPTLHQRLGGRHAVALVVDEFVANVVKDNRINARFKTLTPEQVAKFKTNLSDQICEAAGGPCAYLGKDMKTAHEGMKITDAEFTATVEALVAALDKFQVSEKEKGELLGLLGPMKKDIVGQ